MTGGARRARLLASLLIGTGALVLPLALIPARPTADSAADAKRLALEVLSAALLLALALHGPWRLGESLRRFRAPLLLAAWLALTAALARWPLQSLVALWPSLGGIGLFIAVQAAHPSARQVAQWWRCLAVSATLVALAALLPDPLTRWAVADLPARFRFASTFGNPEATASFLAPVICLWAARLVGAPPPRTWQRAVAGGLLALWTAVLVLTASRGPVLGLVAGLVVAGPLAAGGRRPPRGMVAIAVCAALLLGAVHLALGDRSPVAPLAQRMARALDLNTASVHQRVTIWTLSAALIWQSPLWGHGWGSFEYLFQEELARRAADDPDGLWELEARGLAGRIPYHVHCDYLEIALSSGLVGLGLFLWVLSEALLGAPWGHARAHAGAWGVVVCLAVIAAVSFPLQRAAHLALFWTALGVCRTAPLPRGGRHARG